MKEKKSSVLDVKMIQSMLPHRYPILLVDRIICLDLADNSIIGQKNVTVNEQVFQGHFPGVPIFPGVLALEALAQTGGILVYEKGYKDKIALLLNISQAKFRKPIIPGDVVYLHVKALHISCKGGKMKAKAIVENKVAVEAELSFALVDKKQL